MLRTPRPPKGLRGELETCHDFEGITPSLAIALELVDDGAGLSGPALEVRASFVRMFRYCGETRIRGMFGASHPLSIVRVAGRIYADAERPYLFIRQTAESGGPVELDEAERIVRALRTLDRAMRKADEVLGHSNATRPELMLADHLTRLAMVTGAEYILARKGPAIWVPVHGGWDRHEWQRIHPHDIGARLRGWVQAWRSACTTT